MDELKINVEKGASGAAIYRLNGALTLNTLFDFQDTARKETASAVVLDLSGVPYMDSAGLGAVLGVLASCQRHGRGFGLACVNDRIKTLFTVGHVDGLIPCFDSVEIAESKLVKSASA
ncbi:MAG TPA: STAS domain-containing protein [Bryobacteraceae bacterium]|nr:STAS domain-containing protein [Bryobacteraceae bacterium]